MKKLIAVTLLMFFVIYITSCSLESDEIVKMPKIIGFQVRKIYKINNNLLANYVDVSGNSIFFKLNEGSETWKRILFKTNVSFRQ